MNLLSTTDEIQQDIVLAKTGDSDLNAALTSTSQVAEWRLWTRVVAKVINTFLSVLRIFKAEIDNLIAAKKAHTLKWYVSKAKEFQYGVSLPADNDEYAVVPPVDSSVLIVTEAAAIELPSGKVRLKVATGNPLAALSSLQKAALTAYMTRVKDAGVRLEITSGAHDDLRLHLDVYYDPLVLKNDGSRIDGTAATPLKDGIKAFLKAIIFNGLFVPDSLRDAMKAVEGIVIVDINLMQARYAALAYADIDYQYNPDAGYLALDETDFDANITYTAHEPIS